MNSNALDRRLVPVDDSSPGSWSFGPAERAEVVQARRVTDNDWRLTLDGTPALAEQLQAVVHAAPTAAQGTCRTVGPSGRNHVRLEIGCRGPHLLANLLETVIDDHAACHPDVQLTATLQVDDSMRPRRIDVLVPLSAGRQSRTEGDSPGLIPGLVHGLVQGLTGLAPTHLA